MAHVDGMNVIVEDRHGPERDAGLLDELGESLAYDFNLLGCKHDGRVIEHFLGRFAQAPVVWNMSHEFVVPNSGWWAKAQKLKLANVIGSRTSGVIWLSEPIGTHDAVVCDDTCKVCSEYVMY